MVEVTIDTKSSLYKNVTSRIEEFEVKEVEKGVFEVKRGDEVHEVTLLETDRPRTFVSSCTCGKSLCEHVVAVAYLAKVKGNFELPKHRDFRKLSELEPYLYFHEDFTRGDVLSRARMVSPLEVKAEVVDGNLEIFARFDDCETRLVVDREGHVRGACTCLKYDKKLPCMHMAHLFEEFGKDAIEQKVAPAKKQRIFREEGAGAGSEAGANEGAETSDVDKADKAVLTVSGAQLLEREEERIAELVEEADVRQIILSLTGDYKDLPMLYRIRTKTGERVIPSWAAITKAARLQK